MNKKVVVLGATGAMGRYLVPKLAAKSFQVDAVTIDDVPGDMPNVREVLKANPPSVALDCVGGAAQGGYLEEMAFGGRWIIIATLAGAETTVDLRNLFKKRIKLIGSTLRSRTSEEKSRIMSSLEKELWPLFTQGKLVNHIHAVYPITEAEAAHGVLRRSENTGKVILTF